MGVCMRICHASEKILECKLISTIPGNYVYPPNFLLRYQFVSSILKVSVFDLMGLEMYVFSHLLLNQLSLYRYYVVLAIIILRL